MNTQTKGNQALGAAIAYFTSINYKVSVPLTDSQLYDLIVDDTTKLFKVQVKYAGALVKETYRVSLRTCGANTKVNWAKPFDSTASDLLFILSGNGSKYLIKTNELLVTNALNLGKKCDKFLV